MKCETSFIYIHKTVKNALNISEIENNSCKTFQIILYKFIKNNLTITIIITITILNAQCSIFPVQILQGSRIIQNCCKEIFNVVVAVH